MELGRAGKILLVQLGGIGDALLSVPFCAALRRHWPEASVHLLAVPRVCAFMKAYDFIDRTIAFSPDLFSAAGAVFSMRKKYDLAINMRTLVSAQSALRMKMFFYGICPRISAGRNTCGRGAFFNISVPEEDPGIKHDSAYNRDLAMALGIRDYQGTFFLPSDRDASEKVAALLRQASGSLVGAHPGGAPSRRWPADNFIRSLNLIHEREPVTVVLTGSSDERSLLSSIARSIKAPVINCAGELSIGELIALIQRCAVYISNDTSVMHIAAVAGVPQIALMGPGDLTRFDPRVLSRHAFVFYTKAACAPCNKVICRDLRCLRSILPEDVARQACILLGEKKEQLNSI